MIRAINAGFGEPIGLATLGEMYARGIRHIRQGLVKAPGADHGPGVAAPVSAAQIDIMAQELVDAGMTALWIGTLESLPYAPEGSDVELMNEPNLHGWTPDAYAALVRRAVAIAADRGLTLWVGSVSNTGEREQAWLTDVLRRVPEVGALAIHRYPRRDQLPTRGQDGYGSRAEEHQRLMALIHGRRFRMTEFGFHVAPYRVISWWPWWVKQRSEMEQQAFAEYEFTWWEEAGAEAAYWYQLNDGPENKAIARYGARRFDWTWRPVADAFGG